jgi:hypothetical protein
MTPPQVEMASLPRGDVHSRDLLHVAVILLQHTCTLQLTWRQ